MGFIALRCPSCGADIQLDESREFGFCNYCGTRIVQEKTVIEHTGRVSVDGIAGESSLLERAFLYIEDGRFIQADRYFEKVLDINPKCSKAYFAKILCQSNAKSAKELISKMSMPLDKNSCYVKAVRFASSEERKKYESVNESIKQNIAKQGKLLKDRVDFVDKKLAELNNQLTVEEKEYKMLIAKKAVSKVLVIIACGLIGIFSLFLLVGLSVLISDGEAPMFIAGLITIIPPVVLLIWQNGKIKKADKLEKEYKSTKSTIETYEIELAKYQNEYNAWLYKQSQY